MYFNYNAEMLNFVLVLWSSTNTITMHSSAGVWRDLNDSSSHSCSSFFDRDKNLFSSSSASSTLKGRGKTRSIIQSKTSIFLKLFERYLCCSTTQFRFKSFVVSCNLICTLYNCVLIIENKERVYKTKRISLWSTI